MSVPYRRVHVVINPAAGHDQPVLHVLNEVFRRYGVKWEASLTKKFGDATLLARAALANGADLIAGYGGDGTQMEIANAVMGTGVPMAILPGGTGNAMAFELQIPRELPQAVELICQSSRTVSLDLGRIGDRSFMLRTYTGPEPEQVASREMKDKYGLLAYPAAALRLMQNLPVMNHRISVDGATIEAEGFVCFLFNAGSIGGINLPSPPDIDPGDGLLDVVLINKTLRSLRAAVSYTLDVGSAGANIHMWKGKEITVETEQPQQVWIDGEAHGHTPFTATVLHHAIQILAP